ncbi:MAG: chemotaxis protein CheB, partial [Pyrinomonadaceae bacterium]
VRIDHCLPLSEIAPLLVRLANEPVTEEENDSAAEELELEIKIALNELEAFRVVEKLGKLTSFTCPDCHGSLWEMREGSLMRFRCRTGHAYTAESLIAEQRQTIEDLLHNAIRATEENPTLCRYLSEHAREHTDHLTADHFLYQTAENEQRAHLIHQLLQAHERTATANTPGSLAAELAKNRRTAIIESGAGL